MLGLSLCIILGLSIPERSKDSVSRIAHFECFNIVRLIEHEIRKIEGPFRRHFSPVTAPVNNNSTTNSSSVQTGQTTQTTSKTVNLNEISQELSKNCERLDGTRAEVCKDVLKEENVKQIYNFIKEGKRPDFICSSIGYKRVNPSASRIINKNVCSQVITLIKDDFNRSVTPIFMNRNRFGLFRRSNSTTGKSNATAVNGSKLLEDPQTNSSIPQQAQPGAYPPVNNRFTQFFHRKGPRVCRQFADTPNYQQCIILSRIAIRAARPQIKAGNSSESICEFLESSKLITLTDKDVGTIANERDMEQIQRNSRRDRYNRLSDRDSEDIQKDRLSSRRRQHRPDDENAPLRHSDRNLDREKSDDKEKERPKIENNNNN